MNAKEMFEKINYKKVSENENGVMYEDCISQIAFFKKDKTYGIYSMIRGYKTSIELHNAIHQQLLELGWIE